jgi:uncharacterized cupredoxin-like copper-binding protein
MKSKYILLLIFWGLFYSAGSLAAQLEFKETVFNVGPIIEGATISHDFVFVNKSQRSIKLKNVESSCYCIQPKWTATEIEPGKEGEILVTFNAKDKRGPFAQSVIVDYEGSKEPVILTLKGEVHSKGGGSALSENTLFVDTIGNLAIEKREINAGLLKSDQNTEFKIKLKNVGKKNIKILDKFETNPAFELKPQTSQLKKGEETFLVVKYNGEKSKQTDWKTNNSFEQELAFYTQEEKTENKVSLKISGTWQRIYTQEEIANSPKITFETTEFDGGEIIEGQLLTYNFKFTNTGKSDLIIESAKASCGCTATAPKEKVIKPGQSSQIEASFDSHYKQGAQHKTVTVKSNDITNPTVILHIKCNVKPDPFKSNNGAPVNNSEDPFRQY